MVPRVGREVHGVPGTGPEVQEAVGPETLVRLAALTRDLKCRALRLLALAPGDRVLDVGCGPGVDTVAMAPLVGPAGLVVGVDHAEDMVVAARARARERGAEARVVHHRADARALPFGDAVFDACHSDRLCQHVTDPPRVIAEMARVLKDRGRLVVTDADWSTLSIDTAETALERRVVGFLGEAVANGSAGRQLLRLLRRQGLARVSVEVSPIVWTDYDLFRRTSLSLPRIDERLVDSGVVSREELRRLLRDLEEASARREFFATASMVLAAGIKQRASG
jgi:ubiquinone/menaquinone biosynthesis C-methylase UbiE